MSNILFNCSNSDEALSSTFLFKVAFLYSFTMSVMQPGRETLRSPLLVWCFSVLSIGWFSERGNSFSAFPINVLSAVAVGSKLCTSSSKSIRTRSKLRVYCSAFNIWSAHKV